MGGGYAAHFFFVSAHALPAGATKGVSATQFENTRYSPNQYCQASFTRCEIDFGGACGASGAVSIGMIGAAGAFAAAI